MLLVKRTQLITISYLEHQQRREKVCNMPKRLTLIKYSFYSYRHIFVYLYSAVQLPLLIGQHGRTGRNTLQPWVNNSLTLNLIVCRKRQLNLGRISLLKRKALHRRKRIRRKKYGKVKTQRSRFTAPGFFLPTRVSCSGLAVWFKCTYLPNPAPFHIEFPPSNPVPHEDKTAQMNTDTLLHQLPGSTCR